MLLYVISVTADVADARVSGQRDMLSYPATPAPVIATDPAITNQEVDSLMLASVFEVGMTANADAGAIYAAPIFATQPVVGNLTAYSLSL